jgi:hypothetical protein
VQIVLKFAEMYGFDFTSEHKFAQFRNNPIEKFLTDTNLKCLKKVSFKLIETCGVPYILEGLHHFREKINKSIETIKIVEAKQNLVKNLKNLTRNLNFQFNLEINYVLFKKNVKGQTVLTSIRNNHKYCTSIEGEIYTNNYNDEFYDNDIDILYVLPKIRDRYVSSDICKVLKR